jgi:hypothetical protein
MKKTTSTIILLLFICFSALGQRFEFSINAGVNSTFVPDFNNAIFIANDGLNIPGLILIGNSITIFPAATKSKTSPKTGYLIQLEIHKKMRDRINLSLSCGVNSIKYNYETIINLEGTPYIKLDKSSDNYGNPSLFYINIKPLIVSFELSQNKWEIATGPSFNVLILSKNTKNVIVYKDEMIERVYFEQTADFSNFLYGFHLKTSYRILKNSNIFASYQYYFNSVYGTKINSYKTGKECKPNIFELGIGYSFLKN